MAAVVGLVADRELTVWRKSAKGTGLTRAGGGGPRSSRSVASAGGTGRRDPPHLDAGSGPPSWRSPHRRCIRSSPRTEL
jgi:hypothetical protein